jgi:hypothetical protein
MVAGLLAKEAIVAVKAARAKEQYDRWNEL